MKIGSFAHIAASLCAQSAPLDRETEIFPGGGGSFDPKHSRNTVWDAR